MTDSSSLTRIIQKVSPHEIYNLAAQSHVAVSFEEPEYTANSDALGTLRILESIRILGLSKKTKFYQASTSELYGNSKPPQSEATPFKPVSPYGTAKLYSYWITVNYRNAYNIFASNGILFNHESPVRGETFVSRKITLGLSRIKMGLQKTLYLGNIYAKRDWGHARDYVEAQWKILQHNEADDFCIATGKQYSVKDFINEACKLLGIKITWKGKGLKEVAIDQEQNKVFIKIDERYYRPYEVDSLLGNNNKARKKLKWKPKTTFKQLVKEMIDHDLKVASNEKIIKNN